MEPPFTERPEYQFFADLTEDDLLAAELELVRRVATLSMEQDMHSPFLELVEKLAGIALNDP